MSHVVNIYPHHDLLNLAFHQLEVIEKKVSTKQLDGVALDCMACLISLGIGMEALVNFCGDKVVNGWNERWEYKKKVKKCCIALGLNFDESTEPLVTLRALKELRDLFAHAKPLRRTAEVTNPEQLNELMSNSWDHELEHENVVKYYKAVQEFEKIVYANEVVQESGILTAASGWQSKSA